MTKSIQEWLFDPVLGKWIVVAVGILLVVVLIRFVNRSLLQRIQDTDTRYRTRKFTNFLGTVLGGLMIMAVFSDKLGGLTIAFGVAGAGIAFALQEVIASIAGWFAILFSHFYKTGDRVQLGGTKGDVIDIGILRTTLMEVGEWVKGDLYSGRVVRIANSFVFKEPVYNYSGDFPFLWDEIVIPIKYGSNFKRTEEIIKKTITEILTDYSLEAKAAWQDMVKRYLIEDAQVEPMISITADENWISFTIRYVVHYKRRRLTKDLLFRRILSEINDAGNEIVIAGITIGITEAPVIDVRLQESK